MTELKVIALISLVTLATLPSLHATEPFPAGTLLADAGIKTEPEAPAPDPKKDHWFANLWEVPEKSSGKWSFEFGVAIISDNVPVDYLDFDLHSLHGPGGGLTYNFTVARQLAEFDWRVGKIHLRPQLEVPFRFTIVDQNNGEVIPDVNIGIVARWQNFPWNRWIFTTFAAGGGFSYSSPVWKADEQRHPGKDRSEIKFWLPMEFTFALPKYPNYQITAFADHQSGGGLFDVGGVDAWGLGFRFVF